MESASAPLVEEAIGYWLISATRYFAAALTGLLATQCAEQGKPYTVTPPQWGVMAQLSLRDGQAIGETTSDRPLSWPLVVGRHEIEVRDQEGRRATAAVVVK